MHIEGALSFPWGEGDDLEGVDNKPLDAMLVGSCLVVYDSRGDMVDSLGPATLFAQKLVDNSLVPEVGRIAGGIKAFQELKTCLVIDATGSNSDRPDSMESLGSRLSGAMTPKGASLPQAFPETKRRSTPRWKVTIDTPQEVPPAMVIQGLYIGNKTHAANLETLQRTGITHILNVSRDDSRLFENQIVYFNCFVADSVTSDVSQFFDSAYSFISEALDKPGNNVLVHCAGGVSRSTAIVASYIMRANHWSLSATLQAIRDKHPAAAPNCAFIHQLMLLEKSLGVTNPPAPSMPDTVAPAYSEASPNVSLKLPGDSLDPGMTWQDYAAASATPTPLSRKISGGAREETSWNDASRRRHDHDSTRNKARRCQSGFGG
ncbi:hypothetical protein GUITHDRAFT_116478 [Guillardia theta CCMP2712]|uniref:protein-tyrosine-phosphatase n=1 Tax=Guillardia theta (strain CCMP2712) TaxID=905079 RepID=L1INI4_GUITC|nr:hypothetical protein GUITHDRAFT_116478 [Guillardia theta CCMP2712]EKX37365.1 hypothetical protein GUITHDRAFT_116478 [Guillardia theta CCMP2712]|eukprot:XP_005824345.1 hypothetical protein GUITHDRAFT_116478 [Guillardia theta CCMP2712]